MSSLWHQVQPLRQRPPLRESMQEQICHEAGKKRRARGRTVFDTLCEITSTDSTESTTLEDIAHLPPTPPSDDTTTSPKLLTDPPPTPPHTPKKLRHHIPYDSNQDRHGSQHPSTTNVTSPWFTHHPPTNYKSCSTFIGTHTSTRTHTYREPYPNPTTTEEIHQNQEAPYTVTMRKLSLQPPGHTNGLKTWGEIENIEHDYVTHT